MTHALLSIQLSSRAESDLERISNFTFETWGLDQAVDYMSALHESIDLLRSNPMLGRKCNEVASGYRRMEVASHVVFYKMDFNQKIFVGRILHKSMLPKSHLK